MDIPFEKVKEDLCKLHKTDPVVETLDKKKPNWIIDADETGLLIRTLKSQERPRAVTWEMFKQAWECLQQQSKVKAKQLPEPARYEPLSIGV